MADSLQWLQEVPALDGVRVTVMGLGTFGGGVGVTRFLVERGAVVTVTDLRDAGELADSLGQLQASPPAAIHLGGHRDADFENADLVVVSPAVPLESRYLRLATAAGARLTSEINLFCLGCPSRVIGVTGSSGKSTTAAQIHALLQAAGRQCWLGGNIGESLLPRIDEIATDDVVVLELSSFQLEQLDRIRWSPGVAVVTNFAPNHLDRHGTLTRYEHAKQTILRWQQRDDIAVLNADDAAVRNWSTQGAQILFGESAIDGDSVQIRKDKLHVRIAEAHAVVSTEGSLLQGAHNRTNMAAAVAAVVAAAGEAEPNLLEAGLRQFRGLPHRLEEVGAAAGRLFVNDSKSTTPEATLAALKAFRRPVMLIAGGADKGVDLTPLAREIAARAKGVALIGEVGPELGRLMAQGHAGPLPPRYVAASLQQAVQWSFEESDEGDVILLSPGCASFGWFRSYVERGREFVCLVEELRGQ